MRDLYLVAKLSAPAWQLLGALLLVGEKEVSLSTVELTRRTGLHRNSIVPARELLREKGLISFVVDGKVTHYVVLLQEAFNMYEEPIKQEEIEAQPIPLFLTAPAKTEIETLTEEYARLFPSDAKYPLKAEMAKRWLSKLPIEQVLSVMVKAAATNSVKYPKAYITKVITDTKPEQANVEEESEEVSPFLVELMRRGQKHGNELWEKP